MSNRMNQRHTSWSGNIFLIGGAGAAIHAPAPLKKGAEAFCLPERAPARHGAPNGLTPEDFGFDCTNSEQSKFTREGLKNNDVYQHTPRTWRWCRPFTGRGWEAGKSCTVILVSDIDTLDQSYQRRIVRAPAPWSHYSQSSRSYKLVPQTLQCIPRHSEGLGSSSSQNEGSTPSPAVFEFQPHEQAQCAAGEGSVSNFGLASPQKDGSLASRQQEPILLFVSPDR